MDDGQVRLMDKRDLDEVLASNKRLFSESQYEALINVLRLNFEFDPRIIFIIHEIPEQGEDIYTLAMNGGRVITIEIERKTGKYIIDVDNIEEYARKNRKSKLLSRKVDAARYLTSDQG